MISLTYLSTAVRPFDDEELRRLLQMSRDNNQACGITGMLLYADGHFIQTLEGEAAAVDSAFAEIAADPRHRDVILAVREEVASRSFPDWSMGFEELDADEASTLPGFSAFLEAGEDPATVRDLGHAGIFLRIFRDRMR